MKITKKSEYALSALIELAQSDGGRVIRAQDIAEKEKMSVKFLEQVLLPLKHCGILTTKRGAGGGYMLNKPPERITLAEVIRLVDGPLAPVSCVSETAYAACEHNEKLCALKSVMTEVRSAIVGVLEQVTLADLCKRTRELKIMWNKTQ